MIGARVSGGLTTSIMSEVGGQKGAIECLQ